MLALEVTLSTSFTGWRVAPVRDVAPRPIHRISQRPLSHHPSISQLSLVHATSHFGICYYFYDPNAKTSIETYIPRHIGFIRPNVLIKQKSRCLTTEKSKMWTSRKPKVCLLVKYYYYKSKIDRYLAQFPRFYFHLKFMLALPSCIFMFLALCTLYLNYITYKLLQNITILNHSLLLLLFCFKTHDNGKKLFGVKCTLRL